MSSKRKVPLLGLERRVRPRREDKWEPEPESDDDLSDDHGPAKEGIGSPESNDDDDDDDEQDESAESEPESSDDTPKASLTFISFGALARAQASLPPAARKSKTPNPPDHQPPQETRRSLQKEPSKPSKPSKTAPPKRSSKHAPLEQTSKRPVSRMREIIPDNRRKARDPRFDPSVNRIGKLDEAKARSAYAFLDDYRDSEMADLRAQIKATKDERARDELKRQLMSMESKKKSRASKDDEDRLLAEHRRKEKELVAQGKTPFYLKKSEQKKQLLLGRYDRMSKGQVDRAIERRRKKVSGREKKELDGLQRRER